MKKLLLISAVFLLTGCSTLVDSYLMKFDSNEYQTISNIRTTAQLAKEKCDSPDVAADSTALYALTVSFVNYTQFLPHDDKVKHAAVELNKMSAGLRDQYAKGNKVSPTFCKIKFENIENSAKIIQQAVGAKPR
jgi:hypothetical protein